MNTRKFPIVPKLIKINAFAHVISNSQQRWQFYGSTSVFFTDLKQWQNRVGFSLLYHV